MSGLAACTRATESMASVRDEGSVILASGPIVTRLEAERFLQLMRFCEATLVGVLDLLPEARRVTEEEERRS